jgi:hypothetical protein
MIFVAMVGDRWLAMPFFPLNDFDRARDLETGLRR